MNWASRPVLVTGAAGFIGSHLVDALVELNADVTCYIQYDPLGSTGLLSEAALQSTRIVAGDLRDASHVAAAIRGNEVVFHLAALVGIPYSYEAVESYLQTNVEGTLNVLKGCRAAGVERLIHTSTSEVYGTARTVQITEQHELQPQSPYSASKIAADAMAMSWHHSFGLPVATLRPFNTYGPRQSARAIIPAILVQLLANTDSLKLGSLHPTRDFTYVTDTANAFIAIAECDAAVGRVMNAGSETAISMGDLANKIMQITGRQREVVTEDVRVRPAGSEVERLVADATRLREATGWAPSIALDDGIARTAEWFQNNLSAYSALAFQK